MPSRCSVHWWGRPSLTHRFSNRLRSEGLILTVTFGPRLVFFAFHRVVGLSTIDDNGLAQFHVV